MNISLGAIEVTCTSTHTENIGFTALANVNLSTIGSVPMAPAPNTTLIAYRPGWSPEVATLIFNEQIKNSDGSMTVNGLHIISALPGGLNIVVSSATCGSVTPII